MKRKVKMWKRPDSVYLSKTTAMSLHHRFSQVLGKPLTGRTVTFKRNQKSILLPLRNRRRSQVASQRASVWTRIGWRHGFWNFRNKYRRKLRWSPAPFSRFSPAPKRASQGGVLRNKRLQRLTPGKPLQMGQIQGKRNPPTKKELDAELDAYMSLSKSRLDAELDDYMSLSKSRLDAELDEYMAMAGQTEPSWD